MQSKEILVIGANGKTGRRVMEILSQRGHKVRPGSRQAPTPFDWEQEATWPAALQGIATAYVTYFPDLAFPGAEEKIARLSALAKRMGTKRLVLLSGRGETHAKNCETILRDSGVGFTLLRCAWFAQNFSEGYLRDPVLGGSIALPAGDMREPIVDIDDIAEIAAAALTDDRHEGELYEITGPRLLSFAEMAAELSRATGFKVTYQPLTLAEFHSAMTQIGGAFIADVFTHVCDEALDGRNAWLGDGVQRALGRNPRDFATFCDRAATAGAWRVAA